MNCQKCGNDIVDDYYTLQVYAGEPLRESVAEEDCKLCPSCRIELLRWLTTKG